MSELKKLVTEYVDISRYLESVGEVLKDKRARKKELEPAIIDAMRLAGEDVWKIPGKGNIEVKTKTKHKGLSKAFLESELPSILGQTADQAKDTTKQLLERRPAEDVDELKFKMDKESVSEELV